MTRLNRRFAVAVILCLAILAFSVLSLAINLPYAIVSTEASVRWYGIDVCWDIWHTKPVYSIYWGTIEAGSSISKSIYLYNSGTGNVRVRFYTEKWEPLEAENYITLEWDLANPRFYVRSVKKVTLTLSVSSAIQNITNFSFDIVFLGENF